MGQQLIYLNELNNTGVSAGTYGNSAYHPVVTVSTDGRITTVTNTAITITQLNDNLNASSKIISYPV